MLACPTSASQLPAAEVTKTSHRHVDHGVTTTGSETCRPAERLQEHATKLLSDGAVEDKVDGTVDVNEQVTSVRQNDVRRSRLCVQRV